MLTLLLLGFLVGYVWSNESGYKRGKADTLEEIEQRLTEPKPEALPT